MDQVRLELRVRNNVLWHAIFDMWPSVSAFCQIHPFSQGTVGKFLNLTKSPYRSQRYHEDKLLDVAQKLCELFGYSADELFPTVLYVKTLTRRLVVEAGIDRFVSLSEAPASALALPPAQEDGLTADAIQLALEILRPREVFVIEHRYGLNGETAETLEQIAERLNVSNNRVRQIEQNALRKLRHPDSTNILEPLLTVEQRRAKRRAYLQNIYDPAGVERV